MRTHDLQSDLQIKSVVSVLQPAQIDVACWISSGYFCLFFFFFFLVQLAAGRRGWNTVRSAEWSSEGDPSRSRGRLFRGKHFWKVNCASCELQASE